MEFAILGPISVRVDGQEVRLGADKRRTLLALIIDANRPVPSERLFDVLPASPQPAMALRAHMSQLRRVVGRDRLLTVAGGYQLVVADDELDAAAFEDDLIKGRASLARDDAPAASTHLARALNRWRGPALADVASEPWAAAEARRLEELHVGAQELMLDVRLAMGQPHEVVAMATAAVERYPLREAFWASLMLALNDVGSRADAVRAYQRLREVLKSECGRAPSPDLVKLERAIVLNDPSLRNVPLRRKPLVPGAPLPASGPDRNLPGGVLTFLMTDVVESTRLWETYPAEMREALARHDELITVAVESHDGVLVRERGEGDSTFSVFRRATDAATAALVAQLTLTDEPWPHGCVINVRMAMHTGEASERDGDYYGRPVNRVARLRAIAEGGQILVGQSAAEILIDHLPDEAGLKELGVHELRDFDRPETVYLLAGPAPAPAGSQAVLLDLSGAQLHTTENPVLAIDEHRPEAVVRVDRPPEGTAWEVFIDADRKYYDQTGGHDAPFPDGVRPRVIALTDDTVMIGRRNSGRNTEPTIDLSSPVEDFAVSRAHAVLERQGDGSYALLDSGSTNGTFVNDMDSPIPRGQPIPLSSGDRIYLGAWSKLEIRAR